MGVNVSAYMRWGGFLVRSYTITVISNNFLLNMSGNTSGEFTQGGQIVHYTRYADMDSASRTILAYSKMLQGIPALLLSSGHP